MAKPMSPARREQLLAASRYVLDAMAAGALAEDIISGLIRIHAATRSVASGANTLSCVGVRGSCTWSRDRGLLDSWRKNATIRLMADA